MTDRKIITEYDYPPIPIRHFDWTAYFDDIGADDSPYGHGSTEAVAIADLLGQESES